MRYIMNPIIERHVRIIRYWFALMQKSMNNCILRVGYTSVEKNMKGDVQNVLWLSKLKCLLECTSFAEVWLFAQSVDSQVIYTIIKEKTR